MVIEEYAKILSQMIPVKASYMTIDTESISIWQQKPSLKKITIRRYAWCGHGCVAKIRYWRGFIDISDMTYENGEIDWYLGIAEMDCRGWNKPVPLARWLKKLDMVVPSEFSTGTIAGNVMSIWKRPPKWLDGEWLGAGKQKPLAQFIITKDLKDSVNEDGSVRPYDFCSDF